MGGYRRKKEEKEAKDTSGESDAPSDAERMEATALRILTRRSHTRFEIFQKMRQRGYPAAEVNALLDRFTRYGYLDDARAARSRVRYRLESRPVGRRLMGKELIEKGVPADVRETILDEFYAGDTEHELAFDAARRKRKSGGDARKDRERLLRFLERRGFPMRICIETADRIGLKEEMPIDNIEEIESPSWP
ncbi:MAG: regulatory protein RecX [bacterium]|nr:regulatory protein RecX [bacterium]